MRHLYMSEMTPWDFTLNKTGAMDSGSLDSSYGVIMVIFSGDKPRGVKAYLVRDSNLSRK